MHEVDGLTVVRSPLLHSLPNLTHAFSTRLGGGTPAPLDSFNLGRHMDGEETRQDAMENRKRLCSAFNLPFDKLAVPGQRHTSNVHFLDDSNFAANQVNLSDIDAVATSSCNQPIMLHFADCVPVILVDDLQELLVVVHAGWRGTAGSITKVAVKTLLAHGAKLEHIKCAIGPAIGSCCYQTGADVAEAVAATVESSAGLLQLRQGVFYPDLKALNALQALESGVRSVDVTSLCTACHPKMFYSHRQSGGLTGRQGALACLIKSK